LKRFCTRTGHTPDQLVTLPKNSVEHLIQDYADGFAKRDRSRGYVNIILKRLNTFFTVNGYDRLDLRRYYQPTRYRKRPEYVPTRNEVHAMANAVGNTRNRALILSLWSSGFRVSTLCALNYEDIAHELENEETIIKVPVYPEMKDRVPDAAKGQIPYFSFVCIEAGRALRVYLREREERFGPVRLVDPLFHSDWHLYRRGDRSSRRLGRRGIGLVVKRAAKLAGLREWPHVSPHCLRKAFESVLRSPTVDGGRMDMGTQQFLFGHILPGSMDTYYDREKVEFHRIEYGKLDFTGGGVSGRTMDKMIDIGELERHFEEGWMFVSRLGDDKVVVRRNA